MLLLSFLLLVGGALFTEGKGYRGHHLLSAKAGTEQQLQVLHKLEENYDLVFLRGPSSLLSTDLVVPPDHMESTMTALRDAGITVSVQSPDVQAEIDAERNEALSRERRASGKDNIDDHSRYRPFEDVHKFLTDVTDTYPHLARMEPLPHPTHEGKTVDALEIGTNDKTKPVIFIETLAHAREWVSTASVLYFISEMVGGFGNDPTITEALTHFNWFIIPVVNPDGYVYSWSGDRYWRKNRRHNGGTCYGVDLNRNFDSRWGEVGVSTNCRSDTYPGTEPFSEPEARNIRDSFWTRRSNIAAFVSVHAFSQILLRPWGHTTTNKPQDLPPNFTKLNETAHKMINTMESLYGSDYTFGTPYSTLGYAASGGSFDWALKENNTILSFCYELRPGRGNNVYGFLLPPQQIVPTGNELLQSLIVLADSL